MRNCECCVIVKIGDTTGQATALVTLSDLKTLLGIKDDHVRRVNRFVFNYFHYMQNFVGFQCHLLCRFVYVHRAIRLEISERSGY